MEKKDKGFMLVAIGLVVENASNGGGSFGAVIVRDSEMIATGVSRKVRQ